MSATTPGIAVAEIQGLYGPFTFSEKLLQKIWAERDFDHAQLATLDGRRLRVVHPGRWNLLGGPDFKQARLRFDDGPVQVADVELHLHAADWQAHGHARDPAYDGVALHVVLFPPKAGHASLGAGGRELPVVVLLPWLNHDLEDYAAEAAVEVLANRPAGRVLELMRRLPEAGLRARLQEYALRRWEQKVHFAGKRLARLGWSAACHQTALEILGYRFNRAPMLRLAGRHPLEDWPGLSPTRVEALAAEERDAWTLAGVRPANHPLRRLQHYAQWVRVVPDWPLRLEALGAALPAVDEEGVTREQRRRHHLSAWRQRLLREAGGGVLGGSRWDTLICDGFLPLLTARTRNGHSGLWYHWFPGDLPEPMVAALRQAGVFVAGTSPISHGPVQGLIGWMLAQDK
jgi:hypothetical protein